MDTYRSSIRYSFKSSNLSANTGKILSGQLQAGEKLVSTRELSVELKVSRNVILEAYDQLLAEGFLFARRGAGTFVAEGTLLPQQTKPLITNKAGDQ